MSAQNLYAISLTRAIYFFISVQFFGKMTIGLFDKRTHEFAVLHACCGIAGTFLKITGLPFYRLTLGLRTCSSGKLKEKFLFSIMMDNFCTSIHQLLKFFLYVIQPMLFLAAILSH